MLNSFILYIFYDLVYPYQNFFDYKNARKITYNYHLPPLNFIEHTSNPTKMSET